jgi:hypothetical protein
MSNYDDNTPNIYLMSGAQRIIDNFLRVNSLNRYNAETLSEEVQLKSYELNSDSDKLLFFNTVKGKDKAQHDKHAEGCDKETCDITDQHEMLTYYIDGFIKDLDVGDSEDYYTYEERESILSILNKVLEDIQELKENQYAIYEKVGADIDDLKSKLDEKKETWVDISKGKAFDWIADGVVKKSIIQGFAQVFNSDGISKFLEG